VAQETGKGKKGKEDWLLDNHCVDRSPILPSAPQKKKKKRDEHAVLAREGERKKKKKKRF